MVVVRTDWCLDVSGVGGVTVTLLPSCQIDHRDGDGVTGHQGVARENTGLQEEYQHSIFTYIAEVFLKARGWLRWMLSPLSQVILARLEFLISASWGSVNLPGLASLS